MMQAGTLFIATADELAEIGGMADPRHHFVCLPLGQAGQELRAQLYLLLDDISLEQALLLESLEFEDEDSGLAVRRLPTHITARLAALDEDDVPHLIEAWSACEASESADINSQELQDLLFAWIALSREAQQQPSSHIYIRGHG